MVNVTGRTGQSISIQMLGVGEVIRRLRLSKKEIESSADLGVIKAGGFIEEEVKESIAGRRAEPKSVTTGQFAKSIEFKKTGNAKGVVAPKLETYPNSNQTTQNIAVMMEKGTSRIQARRHFGNTKARNMNKVKEIIEKEIKLGVI